MKRIVLLSTAIITGLVVTTAANARGFGGAGGPGMMIDPPSFADLDTDGDGKVTLEELKAYAEIAASKRFQEADTDGDGKLSGEEMTAAREKARTERQAARQQAMIERLDTDGDGFVSEEEMKAAMEARADARDGNRDGKRDGKNMGKRGGGKSMRGGDMEQMGERMIKRFDIDNDGALNEQEFAKMQELAKERMDGKRSAPFWRK